MSGRHTGQSTDHRYRRVDQIQFSLPIPIDDTGKSEQHRQEVFE